MSTSNTTKIAIQFNIMNGNSDNKHTAKKARHAGHVVLNVGGTRFSTSITTLSNSSAYFESLLSLLS
eukprot:scaffold58594_cov77-Cyclotella_meneghiniana.AAC.2